MIPACCCFQGEDAGGIFFNEISQARCEMTTCLVSRSDDPLGIRGIHGGPQPSEMEMALL